jgi:hypothetical protein
MEKGKVTHRTAFRFTVLVSVTDPIENLHCAWRVTNGCTGRWIMRWISQWIRLWITLWVIDKSWVAGSMEV